MYLFIAGENQDVIKEILSYKFWNAKMIPWKLEDFNGKCYFMYLGKKLRFAGIYFQ